MSNPTRDAPPAHVLAAFGGGSGPGLPEPEALPGGQGGAFRFGDVVVKKVDDPAEASWVATTFEQLRVGQGIRVARPVRSSDGRWVVAGWSAQRYVSGRPEPRYDDIIEASLALHTALAGIPEPKFLTHRNDLYSRADRLAWGQVPSQEVDLGDGHGARLFADLAAGRRPVQADNQIVHGDMFGNVLFAGSAPPAVVDITPYWRPPVWAAAVIAIDALSWGGAQTDLLTDWSHLSQWPQMLRRALMFRVAVSLAHPRTTTSSMVEMLSAAEVIRPFLD